MQIHEYYIKRCLQIAKNGLGTTRPNPMVGALIVHNNKIIGEGFTSEYGGPHAEVNAINAVKDKSLLKYSTIYVLLEPCSHFGKTPPCSDLIIKHGIPNVIIGCVDDNPEVAGKGIAKLKAHGCNVIVGVLEKECKAHLKRFFTFHNKKRPYVILKWAQSQDGFIAPLHKNDRKPVWITNIYSRQLVHKWRAEEQSILVGTKTVVDDNPSLTVRDYEGQNPVRIVLDLNNKLNDNYRIFDTSAKTIKLINKELSINEPLASQICRKLYQGNINSVIVEGGAKTLQTFIDEDLWDEARLFIGKTEFREGLKAPKFKGRLVSEQHINDDCLKIYRND
ncbi:bifunctional diaminohydroxyphosphoribosylaminopyrimidine deaminase/5-amino-6-(5-phosphoribosylamino)uracil reductase RibD [Winogradskyella aquimaris]|uniref:Riboflavin biosynthesis protein RibD n=1 Tax=Winogradskyella aquimaris TaxID=864074 RepID=A0ABU5EQ86_9FLAO|nr:bifunctional diaminohydroxyphosphoribosylaminopyrimidine deaminase/5-amino-6-(5-phosphoribosylamino)uracil reductase RibD [Winogradskyella aquimaris]MDY2587675.1 bifunctional diaminohydroxyphosphoribosylaminopyrimidine deaminase/5-amino-6-(5-phosphoribosylamino)uracil reductase RibD [Winogradskyella aquimaris]